MQMTQLTQTLKGKETLEKDLSSFITIDNFKWTRENRYISYCRQIRLWEEPSLNLYYGHTLNILKGFLSFDLVPQFGHLFRSGRH